MPVFKFVAEDGMWLTDTRLNTTVWNPGDRPRGRDTLEVVEVRARDPLATLVVKVVSHSA